MGIVDSVRTSVFLLDAAGVLPREIVSIIVPTNAIPG